MWKTKDIRKKLGDVYEKEIFYCHLSFLISKHVWKIFMLFYFIAILFFMNFFYLHNFYTNQTSPLRKCFHSKIFHYILHKSLPLYSSWFFISFQFFLLNLVLWIMFSDFYPEFCTINLNVGTSNKWFKVHNAHPSLAETCFYFFFLIPFFFY